MGTHDRLKWIAGVAMLVVAGGAWDAARAGNLDLPTAQYYSVVIAPGDSFYYGGSETDVTLTVDDITYTAQIDPCDLFSRCEFFEESEVTPFSDQDTFLNTFYGPTTLPGVAGGLGTTSWGATQTVFANAVLAKGQFLRLEMSEGSAGGASVVFDAMSHSVYGEFIDKMKEKKASDHSVTEWNRVPEVSTGAGLVTETATATDAMTEAVGVSTWAVPTSESRHYQSPQIVQKVETNWNHVWLNNVTAISDYGTYREAFAMVKGRVFIGTEGAPVENFDITITHP